MAPKARVQKRLYYKIGEACKTLGIQPYVLRYWETEFPALSPSKSRSGQRVYSEKELEVIRRIKQLLYDEGYTIAGAKKKLEAELAAGTLGEAVPAGAPPPAATVNGPGVFQTIGEPRGLQHRQAAAAAAAAEGVGLAGSGGLANPGPSEPHSGTLPGAGGPILAAGKGPGPVRAVPVPLMPEAAVRGVSSGPGGSGTPAEGPSPSRGRAARPTAAGDEVDTAAAAGPSGNAWPDRPTLPLVPPAAPGVSSQPPLPGPARLSAAPPATIAPIARPAAADPEPRLDTSAAKQIETLRKGIQKALQEAREILALLDSRSPR